jgi:hypothetical protein
VLDIELITSLILAGESFVGLPDRCYRYRRHDSSATAEYTRTLYRFEEESNLYDRLLKESRLRGWHECARLAEQRRIIKLNVAFRAMKSFMGFEWAQTAKELRMLFQMSRKRGDSC